MLNLSPESSRGRGRSWFGQLHWTAGLVINVPITSMLYNNACCTYLTYKDLVRPDHDHLNAHAVITMSQSSAIIRHAPCQCVSNVRMTFVQTIIDILAIQLRCMAIMVLYVWSDRVNVGRQMEQSYRGTLLSLQQQECGTHFIVSFFRQGLLNLFEGEAHLQHFLCEKRIMHDYMECQFQFDFVWVMSRVSVTLRSSSSFSMLTLREAE